MYQVKMIFVLIKVGTNLWVNPVQVTAVFVENPGVVRVCVASDAYCRATDWTIDQVRAALAPAAVSKAMEAK